MSAQRTDTETHENDARDDDGNAAGRSPPQKIRFTFAIWPAQSDEQAGTTLCGLVSYKALTFRAPSALLLPSLVVPRLQASCCVVRGSP